MGPLIRTLGCLLLLVTRAATAAPGDPSLAKGDDVIFANGFEVGIGPLEFVAVATDQSTCPDPDTTSRILNTRTGNPITFCYYLTNNGSTPLLQQRIEDSRYGVVFDGALTVQPSETVLVVDPGSPRIADEKTLHIVNWFSSDAIATTRYSRSITVNVAPAVTLWRLLNLDANDCPEGITPFFPPVFVSGYTHLTVPTDTEITHCFRAENSGVGTFSELTDHELIDEVLGTLLQDDTGLENFEIYTVAFTENLLQSDTYQATWSATDGTDLVSSTSQSVVDVVADPACSGITEGTTYAYLADVDIGLPTSANIRIDYAVTATPARSNESLSIVAHGAITSLFPDGAFGPRRDTRIILEIPAGIDLASPIVVDATINEGQPISATVDLDAQTIVLSTGQVLGAPAEVDINMTVTPDGSVSLIEWLAPKLELDVEPNQNVTITTAIKPDEAAPPVLSTPLCMGL